MMSDDTAAVSGEALRLSELGLLTAGLVHELRQPIFALKALGQLGEAQPHRAAEYLAQVLGQVRTLEALIEGYADFSRPSVGTSDVFEIATPVRSAMGVLFHRASSAHVQLDLDLGEPVAVRGSLLAVQQAVVNLGQNAIDALAGQPGGQLRIRCFVDEDRAVVQIDDNGPGLPSDILANLFVPFRTTKATGTGLGLKLTRDVLERSGAALALCDVDAGTRWEIAVPRAE